MPMHQAAMLKEIKEGQQATPKLLKQQPNTSQQAPVKHCKICSCNSHHTNECPQLQDDNTIASSHNFYENPQANALLSNYEEALRSFQQENRELREAQKRIETQLSNITDLITKFTNQVAINPQPPSQPSNSSLLPSQPLLNPKGGINMVHNKGTKDEEEDEKEDEEEEEEDDWLYELLAELENSDNSDDEEDFEEDDTKKEDEEGTFFVATVYGKDKVVKEEMLVKCEDPGPCLVTCKIRGVKISDCMCDPGACGSVMPFEVYETLDLGPLKKSNEIFNLVDKSVVSMWLALPEMSS
ncbi:hypothetical protein PIB30_074061 [Stylosanthes scabra]|uniref:Uncharacterized protein n=1 Tax=Stylosanthes scabra TaxID=79078 RepID=A0ABU6QPM3_9FABA|nr:hypothetical protein [Stylosanthes scabra]